MNSLKENMQRKAVEQSRIEEERGAEYRYLKVDNTSQHITSQHGK